MIIEIIIGGIKEINKLIVISKINSFMIIKIIKEITIILDNQEEVWIIKKEVIKTEEVKTEEVKTGVINKMKIIKIEEIIDTFKII